MQSGLEFNLCERGRSSRASKGVRRVGRLVWSAEGHVRRADFGSSGECWRSTRASGEGAPDMQPAAGVPEILRVARLVSSFARVERHRVSAETSCPIARDRKRQSITGRESNRFHEMLRCSAAPPHGWRYGIEQTQFVQLATAANES